MIKRKNKGWSKRLEERILNELPQVMESAMLRVESESKRIVYLGHPEGHLDRQTGTLGRSITTEVETLPDKTIVATTGTNVVYAATHEFGDERVINRKTVHIPARPFLIPALHSQEDKVLQTYFEGVKKILDKEKIH